MNYITKRTLSLVLLFSLIAFTSCNDDNPKPIFGVAFETTELGIEDANTPLDVKVTFTVAATIASQLSIEVAETGVSHGVEYQTSPAPVSNIIILNVPVGAESVSFSITRLAQLIDSGKEVKFTIKSITGETNSVITGNTSVVVKFEAVASPSGNIVADIGGATEPNQVFIDFSLNKQTTAARIAWDLGFYAGDQNRVVLNYSTYMVAKVLDKNDMTAVTSADTVGMKKSLNIGLPNSDVFIDKPNGDLASTVIAEISATDSENKVYIINRGGGPGTTPPNLGSVNVSSTPRGWKKVRILRSGTGYKVQYADINSNTFQEATIAKNSLYNFSYFSFDNGLVNIEPEKSKWEICLTVSSNLTTSDGVPYAYGYSDFIKTNGTGGTTVVEVATKVADENGTLQDTGAKSYDNFSLADVTGLTFSNSNTAIADRWRSVFTRTTYDYRYYVIKDAEGHYYKVQFLGLLNDSGERGHSSFKYALLK